MLCSIRLAMAVALVVFVGSGCEQVRSAPPGEDANTAADQRAEGDEAAVTVGEGSAAPPQDPSPWGEWASCPRLMEWGPAFHVLKLEREVGRFSRIMFFPDDDDPLKWTGLAAQSGAVRVDEKRLVPDEALKGAVWEYVVHDDRSLSVTYREPNGKTTETIRFHRIDR